MADVEKIQKDIDELVGWSRTWLLNFNAGKCKVMHVGARYFMEGTEIRRCQRKGIWRLWWTKN